jgi:hypothetical protein
MRSHSWIRTAAAALTLAAPIDLWAQGQGHGRGRGHADKHDADVRIDDDGDHDRSEDLVRGRHVVLIRELDDLDELDDDEVLVLRDSRGRTVVVGRSDVERRFPVTVERGGGPAFCRSGAGHPVWGRDWCLEKGFGLGTRPVVLGDGRVFFDLGGDVVVARADVRDDRGWIERVVDRIVFWVD